MLTERQFLNRRREATREATTNMVNATAAGNRLLAQHWLHEAFRIREQVYGCEPDIRVRTPYDAAIEREHER